mmetsp:Transcript_17796/g.41068  ORF Transcript_17796/g.41068 Transcript_17796/m.41068 type:complete len:209 (+) Transcript_17796:2-628(+)
MQHAGRAWGMGVRAATRGLIYSGGHGGANLNSCRYFAAVPPKAQALIMQRLAPEGEVVVPSQFEMESLIEQVEAASEDGEKESIKQHIGEIQTTIGEIGELNTKLAALQAERAKLRAYSNQTSESSNREVVALGIAGFTGAFAVAVDPIFFLMFIPAFMQYRKATNHIRIRDQGRARLAEANTESHELGEKLEERMKALELLIGLQKP